MTIFLGRPVHTFLFIRIIKKIIMYNSYLKEGWIVQKKLSNPTSLSVFFFSTCLLFFQLSSISQHFLSKFKFVRTFYSTFSAFSLKVTFSVLFGANLRQIYHFFITFPIFLCSKAYESYIRVWHFYLELNNFLQESPHLKHVSKNLYRNSKGSTTKKKLKRLYQPKLTAT